MVGGRLRRGIGAQGHHENFPVASVLVPRRMRRHIAAVYAFARVADDFADEGAHSADDRLRLLDGWSVRLRRAAMSETAGPSPQTGEPPDTAAIFQRVARSIRECALPVSLFEDLLDAFRQDVRVSRYETWTELLDYCRRSANPVGRLVLRIAGYEDPTLDAQSDAICSALQLTNFWQDLRIDFDRGRIYLPAEERRAHGAREDDLAAGAVSDGWRRALATAVQRTRAMFETGRPLCDAVRGRLRYELRATWLGGTRILDRLERAGFDAVNHRPTIGAADAPWFAWRLLTWSPACVDSGSPPGLRAL
jgi:squalene synthase HpnC